jgi:prepilin-type N-terminal cleavage/methylation domain-containing protein
MRDDRGFALAELLIAAALIGLVMAGTFMVLQQGQNAYLYGAGRAEVQQTARGALDRLVRELRTGSAVTAVSATSITFQYVDDTQTTVTVQYSLNGTDLQRNQTAPVPGTPQPEIVIGGVNTLAITAYTAGNVATTTAANVRSVNIRLTTQSQEATLASYSPANRRAVVEDRVRLRNLI